jgi:hypothetical protein
VARCTPPSTQPFLAVPEAARASALRGDAPASMPGLPCGDGAAQCVAQVGRMIESGRLIDGPCTVLCRSLCLTRTDRVRRLRAEWSAAVARANWHLHVRSGSVR